MALREKLESGALCGAVLDVFDQEPLPRDSPYWTTKILLVLPHISCVDPRYIEHLLDFWFLNFERFLTGKKLKNIVDRQLGSYAIPAAGSACSRTALSMFGHESICSNRYPC